MTVRDGYTCPPFVIQEPYGAAGIVDVPVTPANRLYVVQRLNVLPIEVDALCAQLLVDDVVVATSYQAYITPLSQPQEDGATHLVECEFPPLSLAVNHYGIRYLAKMADGVIRQASMHPAC